jgi:hypothetical protein
MGIHNKENGAFFKVFIVNVPEEHFMTYHFAAKDKKDMVSRNLKPCH